MTLKRSSRILAVIAIVFGALTVVSGGRALFAGASARASVGAAVDFVLWFNFLAGSFYIVAGFALLRRWRWGRWLAALLTLSTALVMLAFGMHVAGGGAYEVRTVGAMTLRLGFWFILTLVVWRDFGTIK